ncbi:hypothetical protein B0H99_10111 [Planomicrobium soli]|uniref:Uncharacterized protein n=1 Tax=Planomicrobium soli TaxID=1176648 RepID=A0A2P8H6C6_9BACL|nr:hypothetical protein B0H99_10111 [Planomicrobium soli]
MIKTPPITADRQEFFSSLMDGQFLKIFVKEYVSAIAILFSFKLAFMSKGN